MDGVPYDIEPPDCGPRGCRPGDVPAGFWPAPGEILPGEEAVPEPGFNKPMKWFDHMEEKLLSE
jgi:hypothetical protein